MKLLLTICLIFTLSVTWGQDPSLRYMPHDSKGTNGTLYMLKGDFSELNIKGENVTWDLSDNLLIPIGKFNIVDPKDTPYENEYPDANVSYEQIIPNRPIVYHYFENSPREFNSVADNIGSPLAISYSDYNKAIQYPFKYGDSFTDIREGTNISETFTRTYDAYGTLIVNGKTYSNVIRIYKNPNSVIFFTSSPAIVPIITIGGAFVTYVEPTFPTRRNDVKELSINVCPTYASDAIKVISHGHSIASLKILNYMGLVVKTISDRDEIEKSIPVYDLVSGWYTIQALSDDGEVITTRFYKQ